jgi:hypothetical protein
MRKQPPRTARPAAARSPFANLIELALLRRRREVQRAAAAVSGQRVPEAAGRKPRRPPDGKPK